MPSFLKYCCGCIRNSKSSGIKDTPREKSDASRKSKSEHIIKKAVLEKPPLINKLKDNGQSQFSKGRTQHRTFFERGLNLDEVATDENTPLLLPREKTRTNFQITPEDDTKKKSLISRVMEKPKNERKGRKVSNALESHRVTNKETFLGPQGNTSTKPPPRQRPHNTCYLKQELDKHKGKKKRKNSLRSKGTGKARRKKRKIHISMKSKNQPRKTKPRASFIKKRRPKRRRKTRKARRRRNKTTKRKKMRMPTGRKRMKGRFLSQNQARRKRLSRLPTQTKAKISRGRQGASPEQTISVRTVQPSIKYGASQQSSILDPTRPSIKVSDIAQCLDNNGQVLVVATETHAVSSSPSEKTKRPKTKKPGTKKTVARRTGSRKRRTKRSRPKSVNKSTQTGPLRKSILLPPEEVQYKASLIISSVPSICSSENVSIHQHSDISQCSTYTTGQGSRITADQAELSKRAQRRDKRSEGFDISTIVDLLGDNVARLGSSSNEVSKGKLFNTPVLLIPLSDGSKTDKIRQSSRKLDERSTSSSLSISLSRFSETINSISMSPSSFSEIRNSLSISSETSKKRTKIKHIKIPPKKNTSVACNLSPNAPSANTTYVSETTIGPTDDKQHVPPQTTTVNISVSTTQRSSTLGDCLKTTPNQQDTGTFARIVTPADNNPLPPLKSEQSFTSFTSSTTSMSEDSMETESTSKSLSISRFD